MVSSAQEIFAPVYVAEPSEPLFIQNSFTEAQDPIGTPKKIGGKFNSYCPGAMLAQSAFIAEQYGTQAFANDMMSPAFGSPAPGSDKESESECSTADTSHEALSRKISEDCVEFMMSPNLAMMADNTWQSYPGAGYWPMPYPPPVQESEPWTQQMPIVSREPWSQQMPSAGSSGHRLGRCKPCAFMYKDGCRSGADCPYCHLCPPGEKQRRKRVMRSMQRNMSE